MDLGAEGSGARATKPPPGPAARVKPMRAEPADGRPMSDEAAVRIERVRSAFEQIPAAAAVTVVNAGLMAAVLVAAEQDRRAYAWIAVVMLVTAARLALWRAFRRAT